MHSKTRLISLRITDRLRRRLQAYAKKREISTTQLMRFLLEDGLDNNPSHVKFSRAVPNHRED